MYSIGHISELTGVSSYTLRYYEKIGLLPSPVRNSGGIRKYTDKDIRFIHFLNGLKKTGMSLQDITEFVKDGCILEKISEGKDVHPSIQKRFDILTKHLGMMETQLTELENIISLTKEKLTIYHAILEKDGGFK